MIPDDTPAIVLSLDAHQREVLLSAIQYVSEATLGDDDPDLDLDPLLALRCALGAVDGPTTYSMAAFKPAGEDYCRGCLMASWPHEQRTIRGLTREQAAEALAVIRTQVYTFAEPKWRTRAFADGPVSDPSDLGLEPLVLAAIARIEAERVAKAEVAKVKAEAAQTARDRATLAALKIKLGEVRP